MIKKCEQCGNRHSGNYGSGRFCSTLCARSFASKKNDKSKRKHGICPVCKRRHLINKQANPTMTYCKKCYKLRRKIKRPCNVCGQPICMKPEYCNRWRLIPSLIKIGLKKKKLGKPSVYREFDRIRYKINKEYHTKELSTIDLATKYNLTPVVIRNIFKGLRISIRSRSDSISLAYKHNKLKPQTKSFKYKNGWHTTWYGKEVYYRSSLELNHCKILDKETTMYDMESLRLRYWDSQSKKTRTAIPDFYLSESNTIIEIKSFYTLNKDRKKMKDKTYKKHSGYPGGFKEVSITKLMKENPKRIIEIAVSGMLPDNRLKSPRMKRFKIFGGPKHQYENMFKNKK